MRAVGYQQPGAIDRADALVDIELPTPTPEGRDLLVEVRAVSVNPVDTKVRKSAKPEPGSWKVLGWDAAGIVVAAGPGVTLFGPGDAVFYAGAIDRPGSNSQFHLVDEHIVGANPRHSTGRMLLPCRSRRSPHGRPCSIGSM
jgi:NADPH:quinone reductase